MTVILLASRNCCSARLALVQYGQYVLLKTTTCESGGERRKRGLAAVPAGRRWVMFRDLTLLPLMVLSTRLLAALITAGEAFVKPAPMYKEDSVGRLQTAGGAGSGKPVAVQRAQSGTREAGAAASQGTQRLERSLPLSARTTQAHTTHLPPQCQGERREPHCRTEEMLDRVDRSTGVNSAFGEDRSPNWKHDRWRAQVPPDAKRLT